MPFKPLLEVRVDHPFYETGPCLAARVVPEPATQARFRGLRLLDRQRPGGLVLLAEFAGADPLVALPETTLKFRLELERELLAATDPGEFPSGTVFVEAGPGKPMKMVTRAARSAEHLAKPAGKAVLALSGRPLEGAKAADFSVLAPAGVSVTSYDEASKRVTLDGPAADVTLDYPVPAPRHSPGAAAIEAAIGPGLAAKSAAGKPQLFQVALKAAAAPWCYHLVTDLPNPVAEWRIDHPQPDGPPAAFGAGAIAEISGVDATDPFGTDLRQRSAPLRVLRFLSDAPVPCSSARARRIAMFAGARQIFTALPNPSPAEVRIVKGKPVFGEVLRFVTD
jgi:hypothetical protein